MADSQLYTNQAAMVKCSDIITALEESSLRLFQSGLVLTRFTTKAQLEAVEADFNGYPEGGYDLAEFTGPIQDPNGGAIMTSPLVNPNFNTPTDPPVGNDIGGFWVEDADGVVRLVGQYDPARPIQTAGDGFPIVIQIVEARNVSV